MNTELWERWDMLPRETRVLCALSGGADSVCLAHLLKSLEDTLGIRVYAAHYEHGLRGEESLRDLRFVEGWCRAQGIPLVTERADVRAYAERKRMNLEEAAQTLSATDIRIDDNPTLTVSDMNAACHRVPDLGLVVVDYLQLLSSSGSGYGWSNESRQQAVSDISRMMKIMAKELNVPVICASQLSRSNEGRQDKRLLLSDLRESGAIEQDADVVIGLYREGYYNKESENPTLAEAIVLKNRKGATGTVELTWLPEYTSFGSVEKRRDDEF